MGTWPFWVGFFLGVLVVLIANAAWAIVHFGATRGREFDAMDKTGKQDSGGHVQVIPPDKERSNEE